MKIFLYKFTLQPHISISREMVTYNISMALNAKVGKN